MSSLRWNGKLNLAITVFALVGVCGCSTIHKIKAPTSSAVSLQQDTYVKTGEGESQLKHKGESVTLGANPVLFESPGHVGVLYIPPHETPTQYKLSLRELPIWGGDEVDRYANSVISEVLSKVTQTQVLLGQHQPQQALDIVHELQQKYPKLTYLSFLESSCYLVMGQREKAASILARALQDFPKDQQAQELYRSIAGEKSGAQP